MDVLPLFLVVGFSTLQRQQTLRIRIRNCRLKTVELFEGNKGAKGVEYRRTGMVKEGGGGIRISYILPPINHQIYIIIYLFGIIIFCVNLRNMEKKIRKIEPLCQYVRHSKLFGL